MNVVYIGDMCGNTDAMWGSTKVTWGSMKAMLPVCGEIRRQFWGRYAGKIEVV